jgi:hypothetical protein
MPVAAQRPTGAAGRGGGIVELRARAGILACSGPRPQRHWCVVFASALAMMAVLAFGSSSVRAALGDCCQPLSDGANPVASDCLFVLQVAVGARICEPACVCAPRGVLPTVASDALACLLVAVGASSALDCRCGASTTTSSTVAPPTTTTTLAPPPDGWEEAFDATDIGWMMSGWGPGDGSLWVVGGALGHGRILHRDASGWGEVDPGVSVPLLNWVHGTSRADVFAGGNDGTVLHYDGHGWSLQDTPVSAAVWGMWAVAPDDVWAVGGNVGSVDPPFILRYDGASWSPAAIPALTHPGVHAFFKVWGSRPDDVYVVGQNGTVLHYDGSGFTELALGVSQDLIGIWGNSANDVMIVGGRSTAEILHFDGAQWRVAPPSSLPGLNGVWTRRPDVAHAVGVNGTVVSIDPSTLEATGETVPTSLQLHGIFGDASGQLIALGANFMIPEHGVALVRGLSNDD